MAVAEQAYITSLGGTSAEFGRNVMNVVEAQNHTNNDTWRIVGASRKQAAAGLRKWPFPARPGSASSSPTRRYGTP